MRRFFDRIEFLVSEAFVALRRNGWMTFSAVATVTVALYLLGGLGYAYFSVVKYAQVLPSKFEMRVFLRENTSSDEINLAAEKIKQIRGVKTVEWLSKDAMWEKQKQEMPEVTEGLDNPLLDAYKITLSDLRQAKVVAEKIKAEPVVDQEGVAYFDEEHQLISDILELIKKLGIVLGGLMLLTSGILIYNTIRLTILARSREFRIMQLLGANYSTVLTPLLIEGLLQGVAGGLISALLLMSSHMSLANMLNSFSALDKLGEFPTSMACAFLSAVGALYGLICSLFSVAEARKRKCV
jgi:cell division transport system permease protein